MIHSDHKHLSGTEVLGSAPRNPSLMTPPRTPLPPLDNQPFTLVDEFAAHPADSRLGFLGRRLCAKRDAMGRMFSRDLAALGSPIISAGKPEGPSTHGYVNEAGLRWALAGKGRVVFRIFDFEEGVWHQVNLSATNLIQCLDQRGFLDLSLTKESRVMVSLGALLDSGQDSLPERAVLIDCQSVGEQPWDVITNAHALYAVICSDDQAPDHLAVEVAGLVEMVPRSTVMASFRSGRPLVLTQGAQFRIRSLLAQVFQETATGRSFGQDALWTEADGGYSVAVQTDCLELALLGIAAGAELVFGEENNGTTRIFLEASVLQNAFASADQIELVLPASTQSGASDSDVRNTRLNFSDLVASYADFGTDQSKTRVVNQSVVDRFRDSSSSSAA